MDDEAELAELLAESLRRSGYEVDTAYGGVEAVGKIRSRTPDLVVLDYEMPDLTAPEVLDELRRSDGTLPVPVVIFTGGRLTSADEVLGIERGAVDYVRKGSDREVLLARVSSILRRTQPPRALIRGRMRIELGSRRIHIGERTIELEPKQFDVLLFLAEREGEVVSREDLLHACWGTGYAGFNHAIDQAIYGIRSQLDEREWIQTVARKGYRFVSRH